MLDIAVDLANDAVALTLTTSVPAVALGSVAAARSVSGATPRRAALSGLRLALTSCAAGCREVVLDSTIRTKLSPSRAHAECVRRTVAVPALVRALDFLRSREWCTLTLVASCAPVELFVSR
ncbi:hypothetical protein BpHYR1_054500, partial [Brachionus plicatilis]